MTLLPLLCAVVAFVLFALSSDRHYQRRFGRPSSVRARRALRGGAWGCVALDFVLAIQIWGGVFGPIWWAGTCMLGASISFLLINALPPRGAVRRPPPHP